MRLEYNPNSSSSITDTLVIGDVSDTYELVKGSMYGFGGVEFQHMSSQSPYQNGGSYYMSRANSRVMSFQFRVYADSVENMQNIKMYLVNMLSSAYGVGELRFYTGAVDSNNKEIYYLLYVVPDGNGTMFQSIDNHNDTMCLCNVNLTAFDPFWYSLPVNVSEVGTYEGGFVLPFSLPFTLGRGGTARVINKGNVPSPCVITLSNSFTSPVILNKTTGEKITVNTTIHAGERLIINTNPQNSSVTLVNSVGTKSSMFNAVSPDSTFFLLQPGANDIVCTDDGGTTRVDVTVEWYNKYTGVF